MNIAIGALRRPPKHAALQQFHEGITTMFATIMKALDRTSFSIFMVLAMTPMAAVAAAASIH